MALKNLGGPEAEPSQDFVLLRVVQFFLVLVFVFVFGYFLLSVLVASWRVRTSYVYPLALVTFRFFHICCFL